MKIKAFFQLSIFSFLLIISSPVFGVDIFVESISFEGNTLFSDFILSRTISLKENTIFSQEKLRTDIRSLKKLHEESGYFRTHIFPNIQRPSTSKMNITFRIQENKPTLIKTLTVDSVGKPKSKKIKELFSLKTGDIYTDAALKKDLQKLKIYLFEKKHLSARIISELISFTLDKRGVHIFIKVNPGPQYNFDFKGLEFFSTSELLSPFLTDPMAGLTISPDEIASYIITSYQKNGFYHVEVSYSEDLDIHKNKKRIIFHIYEHSRVKILDFVIQGNKHFSEEHYKDLIPRISSPIIAKKYFSQTDLDLLPIRLETYLKDQGFFKPKIVIQNLNWDLERRSISPEILMNEGPRTFIKNIFFDGHAAFSSAQLSEVLDLPKEGFLPFNQLQSHLLNVIEFYKQHGFLKCKIENLDSENLIVYSQDSKTASLHIKISEGPQVKIGDIIIRGAARTKYRVLEREFTFKEGMVWNPREIEKTEARLLKLGLFSSVRIYSQKEFHSGKNDLIIEVVERLPGLAELGGGFKSDDGFHAFSGIAYRNVGGWHRVFSIRGDINRKIRGYHFLERKVDFGFSEPYLGAIPFITRLNITHKKNSTLPFDILSWDAKLSLDKHFWDFLRFTLQYDYQYRDIFRAIDIKDIQDNVVASLGPSLFFDFRDNSFNPKKGFSLLLSTLFFLPELGSDPEVSLTRNRLSSTWYISPLSWLTFAFLGQGGYAHSFSAIHPIPVDQRFYLGGRSTIRGFEEDIIGSDTKNRRIFETSFINYKTEVRVTLFSDFGIAVFLDGGNVFFDSPTSNNKFRHSFGPGLRYSTPIGPLSLDYGFIINRIEAANEPVGRFHFSIGLF